MPMDKPIAKCRNCDRESSGSQILILDSELNESGSLISPFKDILGYNHKNDEDGRNGKKKGLGDLLRQVPTASSTLYLY